MIHAIDRVILPQQPSIAGIAIDTPDLSILVDALSRAGLVQTLSYPGDYTVFAPTNAGLHSRTTLARSIVGDPRSIVGHP